MQVNCSWVRNFMIRWSGVSLALVSVLAATQVTAQLTFGNATIGDVTAEVGQRIASRVLPTAAGGTLPYTYSLTGLPNGLSFNASDRILSGTPTAISSTSTYSYSVQDNVGATASISFDITVNGATEIRVSTTSGDHSITLEWYGLGTADTYCIRHKLTTESSYSVCSTLTSNGSQELLTETIQNLQLATRYSIFIEAYNSQNTPIESITISASTNADETPRFEPTASIDDIDVRAGGTLITPILPAATGGNGRITYEFDPMLPEGLILDGDRQITGRATTPQPVKSYLYKAVDADGDYSALAFTIRIRERFPFTGLTSVVGDGSLILEWDAVQYARNYLVRYRQRGSSLPWDETSQTAQLTETLSGLTNDVAYDVRVVAIDDNDFEFTWADTTATPGSANQIVVSARGGDGEIRVSWNAILSAQRYLIRYQLGTSTSNFQDVGYATSVPVGGFVVPGLALSTRYTVRVDAYGSTDNLLSSDTATATTTADTVPSFGTTVINPVPIYLGIPLDQILPQRSSGGNQPFTYSISPRLPIGLQFDSATRSISGIPASDAIATNYVYQVRDRHGDSANISFNLELKSFFAREGSGASVDELNPDFSNINDVLARDRLLPDGQNTEPRTVSYHLDERSAETFAVTASTANHKAPVLAIREGKVLDFEAGPRTHRIRIVGTSPDTHGSPITIGQYFFTLSVLNVDEPPQKTIPTQAGQPDEEVHIVGTGFREYVLTSRFFDPEQHPITIATDSLRITNASATIVYAVGPSAAAISVPDQVVKAEVINATLLRIQVDTSQVRLAQSLTNDVRIIARDQGGLESEEFVVRFNVKIGANNPPTFLSGATAVSSTVPENTEHVGTFYATDLDDHVRSNGRHDDRLSFSIQGATRVAFWPSEVLMIEGTCIYVETSRDDQTDRWVATVKSVVSTHPDGSSRCRHGFDFEQGVTPRFVLEVSDGYGGSASVVVTVYIENVDEPATHDISSLSQFQLLVGNSESIDLHSFVDDPENAELSFIVSSYDLRVVSVSESSGILTVTGVGPGRTTVSVSYRDAGGHFGSFQVVALVKHAASNTIPRFLNDVGAVGYEVDENAPAGTAIGRRNIAIDSDVYDELTYSIDSHSDLFAVSSKRGSEGQLSVKHGAMLNFEDTTSYGFTLTVEDGWGGSASLQVSIAVKDVNEPPYLNPATTNNGRIADINAPLGESVEYDLKQYFLDEDAIDQGRLRYNAIVANSLIGRVQATTGGLMVFEGLRLGSTEISATATDNAGHRATLTFTLRVVENAVPQVLNPIPDQTLNVSQLVDISLSQVFYDPDGEVNVLRAEESDDSVVLAILTKNKTELTLFGYSVGVSEVTVTAADSAGSEVTDEFLVTVSASASGGGPRVASRIGDQTVTAGVVHRVDIGDVFTSAETSQIVDIDVHSKNTEIVHGDVDISTKTLSLYGHRPGSVYVSVVAATENGIRVGDLFTTHVETMPEVMGTLADVKLEVGSGAFSVDFGHVFVDQDGDELDYLVEVRNPNLLDVAQAGTSLSLVPVQHGETTIALSATDPKGRSATATFLVSIENGRLRAAAEKALTNYGRTLLSGISTAVETRIKQDSQSTDLTTSRWLEELIHRHVGSRIAGPTGLSSRNVETATALGLQTPASVDFNAPRSIALGFGGTQRGWSLWNESDQHHMDEGTAEVRSRTKLLGIDVKANDRWLVGVAVARSHGNSGFQYGDAVRDMTIETRTVIPYASVDITNATRFWTMLGMGRGTIEIADTRYAEVSPLRTKLWLIGSRQDLSRYRNIEFAIRVDHARLALGTRTDSTSMSRLRSSIERSRVGMQATVEVASQLGSFTPSLDIGMRHDGGAYALGNGLEAAIGLRWQLRALTLETTTRSIRTGSTIQNSTSMLVGMKPNVRGTGLTFTVEPKWGSPLNSSDMIFNDPLRFRQVNGQSFGTDGVRSITSEFGYGLFVNRDSVLFYPFIRYDEEHSNYKLGMFGVRFRHDVDVQNELRMELAVGANEDLQTGSVGSVFSARASLKF